MSAFVMPPEPAYTTPFGHAVYVVDGANTARRRVPGRITQHVVHHTAGVDSRAYLLANDRGVSVHYLIGCYADQVADANPTGLTIIKYASEAGHATHTQGNSKMGREAPFHEAVSYEMEGHAWVDGVVQPVRQEVIALTAKLVGSSISYWYPLGQRDQVVVGHKHIDTSGKIDPAIDWVRFSQAVWANVALPSLIATSRA